MEKSNRRNWTKEETISFLVAYSKRKKEFNDRWQKKYAMANVLEDLVAQNVLKEPTTVECLNIKLKNLLRAYKSSKDNSKRTVCSARFAPLEALMNEIFGDRPIFTITKVQTVPQEDDVGYTTQTTETSAAEEVEDQKDPEEGTSSETLPRSSPNCKKRKKSIKEVYYHKKLELKKLMMEKKIAVLKEEKAKAEAAKQKRHEEKMDILRQFLNK